MDRSTNLHSYVPYSSTSYVKQVGVTYPKNLVTHPCLSAESALSRSIVRNNQPVDERSGYRNYIFNSVLSCDARRF